MWVVWDPSNYHFPYASPCCQGLWEITGVKGQVVDTSMLQKNLPGNEEKLAARKLVNMCAWIIKGIMEKEKHAYLLCSVRQSPVPSTLPTESMLKIKLFHSVILYFKQWFQIWVNSAIFWQNSAFNRRLYSIKFALMENWNDRSCKALIRLD